MALLCLQAGELVLLCFISSTFLLSPNISHTYCMPNFYIVIVLLG